VGAVAFVGCGDDDGDGTGTAGRGGSAGSAGSAGSGGAGGAGGAGGSGGSAGTTGGGGSGGAPAASPCVGAAEGGCAQLFIPTAVAAGNVDFEIDLGATTPVDMSGSTVTVRLKALAGTTGNVQVYVKNGQPQGFAGYYTGFTALTTDFQNIVVNLAPCPVIAGGDAGGGEVADAGDAGAAVVCGPATFDKSAVRFIGVQVLTPGANTQIQVDSIKFSPNPPADFTFATGVEGLVANAFSTPPPPAGTAVTFAAAP